MRMAEFEQDGFEERRERGRRPRRSLVRTTGILQNNLGAAINVHAEVVNLNLDDVEIRVQVLNWGTAVTQTNPVSTALDVTQILMGNTRTAFNAAIPAGSHYEVRLTVEDNEETVLINTYARTAVGGGILNGLTVLDSQFQRVEIENCL